MKRQIRFQALAGCLVVFAMLPTLSPQKVESRDQDTSALYLGQEPPGRTPVVFAPGIVSTGDHEFSCTFSPDGSEFYFARGTGPNNVKQILVTRLEDGAWSDPAPALPSFTSECFEPHVTPDGSRLFFMGFHTPEGQNMPGIDMFYALRDGDGWGEIIRLGEPFNPMNSMTPSTTRDGTLYTCSNQDIVRSRLANGEHQPFENLGAPINTAAFEGYPYVAPDGEYLIFARMQEGMPLLVSFREDDGSWGEPQRIPLGMPAGIPSVSPDGKYLFIVAGQPGDIYWVDAGVFKDLKPQTSELYFGQEPPGRTPVQFAPDVFTRELHSSVVFSPDGNEVYWSEMEGDQIMTMRREEGRWSAPGQVPFALPAGTGEPAFSQDGQKLFFLSFERIDQSRGRYDENIWYVTRTGSGWSQPQPLGPEVNNWELHWQISIASSGNLYFGCREGSGDIYCSRWVDGTYREAEPLGEAINTDNSETTPFIAPDESYLVFSRVNIDMGVRERADLYVSFRDTDGAWNEAVSLGSTINTRPNHELCPIVSHDGLYLFFIRNVQGDLYPHWVSISVIEDLRPN